MYYYAFWISSVIISFFEINSLILVMQTFQSYATDASHSFRRVLQDPAAGPLPAGISLQLYFYVYTSRKKENQAVSCIES